MARGGWRPGAGRKPNPDKPRVVATTKVPDRKPLATAEPLPAEPKRDEGLDGRALAQMLPQIQEIMERYSKRSSLPRSVENNPFRLPVFPKAAIPPKAPGRQMLAMDEMPIFADASTSWLGSGAFAAEGLVFLGYSYLSELAQRPEYRTMAETIADDATRRWIDFDVVGDEKTQKEEREKDPEGYDERMADPDERKKRVVASGKADKVKALKDDQERLEVRDRFYWASCYDSFMGRTHLYLQIGDVDFDAIQGEMASSIGNSRDEASRTKVTPKTPLKYIKTVEPMWTYPLAYNAQNPLAPDWYNPQQWYVMGREINISRLQTFVSRPVPDMLKPAYAFGGLPLTQLAKPYVDIWLQTRQSVADLIKSFSTMVLMTDLATQTAPGNATSLLARMALFTMARDNMGLFVANKNTEDLKNVSAPLSGLHELQAQSQEHMLSVARIPAVKFTGIQPAGLNASSEGEIKVYDDTIEAYQKRALDPNLTRIINFEMLSLFGEIDPEITHRWENLRQLTDSEKAEQAKKEADRDAVYVDMGAISPAEVRRKIIDDEDSPYAGLDPDDVPEPPAQPGMPGMPGEGEVDGEGEGGPEGPDAAGGGPGGAQDLDPFGATDEWNEDDHPRGEGGKFTAGAGGGSSSKTKGGMPDLPDFLKAGSPSHYKAGAAGHKLAMPQFGLTAPPSSWSYKPRPFPKSSGKPEAASSVVVFSQGNEAPAKKLNGKAFKSWEAPSDWSSVEGQADVGEPALPELPKGMTLSSGVVIREPDGRVWMVRPSGGYGGYEQTFPKGGVEEGLSPQANAIKEAYEESGLKVKITGFAGDHEGDTSVTRFYFAERESGDPKDAGWETEGVVLAPVEKLDGFLNRKRDREIAQGLAGTPAAPAAELDPAQLEKKGGKLGSNEGGTFVDKATGETFYVKRPESKAHVANELAAARLYKLAGVETLDYRPVKGGNHVATAWEKLDKNRISQMSDAERAEAAKDFAIHAWLSNWDAAGTGGDNQGVRNGKPVTLDVGGSLRYRAQGGPKGSAFGPKVSEIDTMRDKSKSPDAARLFGKMSDEEIAESVARVTAIPDEKIREAAQDDGLADVLIARKKDLAKRFGLAIDAMDIAFDDGWNESDHPRAANGQFGTGSGSSKPSDVAIRYWSGEGYKTINRGLRSGEPMSEIDKQAISDLDRAMSPIEEPISAYRLVSPDVAAAFEQSVGGRVRDRGFVAVSTNDALAEKNLKKGFVKIGVILPKGTSALSIGSTSSNRGEGEVLVDRGTQFDVTRAAGKLYIRAVPKSVVGASDEAMMIAADEAQWEEGKHPRGPDGKFTSGGGSSGGASGGALSLAEIGQLVAKKPIAGSNYRKALIKAIAATTDSTNKKLLAGNLAMSWAKTGANAFSKGDAATGQKIGKKLTAISKEYGVDVFEATKVLAEGMKSAKAPAAPVKETIAPKGPEKSGAYEPIEPSPGAKSFPPPTPAELEKAKKTVALQMSYVPGPKPEMQGGEPAKQAAKLIEEFNAKWAGKTPLPTALPEKVNDFKALQAKMADLAAVEKKHAAEIAAQAKAAQAEKAKKEAEKAKAAAKAAAEKNAEFIKSLGISETQAEGMVALAQMLGKKGSDLANEFKAYEEKAKAYGYPISGFEAALIANYSNGGYHGINAALRSGKWTPAQHVYVSMVNKALKAMPTFKGGGLTRNTSLTPEQQAAYAQGHVVQEAALMSTSTGNVFSGNTTFKVTAIGKRGASIKKLSHHAGENEVLFAAKTYFHVDKVEGAPGGKMTIHMTEWEDI